MYTNPIKTTLRGGDSAYSAPTLELFEIAVERGFELSPDPEEIEGTGSDNDYSEDYF